MKRLYLHTFVILGLILFTFSPVIAVLAGGLLGEIFGFPVNEAGTAHYYILGFDIAQFASVLCVCGWLIFMTVPVGVLLIIGYIPFMIVLHFTDKRIEKQNVQRQVKSN